MSGALISARKRNTYDRVPVSVCARDILNRYSRLSPISIDECKAFAKRYALENSKSSSQTYNSIVNNFGFGCLVDGKWSIYGFEMSHILEFESAIYCCLSTKQEINRFKKIMEEATQYAEFLGVRYSKLKTCQKCGNSLKRDQNATYCRSCSMKLVHLRKRETELAEVKRLTHKLKKVVKDEIKRTSQASN